MTPNVPMSDSGTATLGIMAVRGLRRNANTTRMTRTIEMIERTLDVAHRCADRRRLIDDHVDVDRLRDRGLHARQHRSNAVDRLDDVGAGLPEDDHHHRRLAVDVAGRPDVLDSNPRAAPTSRMRDRRAVAIGDDERRVVDRLQQLIVGADLPRAGC